MASEELKPEAIKEALQEAQGVLDTAERADCECIKCRMARNLIAIHAQLNSAPAPAIPGKGEKRATVQGSMLYLDGKYVFRIDGHDQWMQHMALRINEILGEAKSIPGIVLLGEDGEPEWHCGVAGESAYRFYMPRDSFLQDLKADGIRYARARLEILGEVK